jgi:hypothetical protein
LTRVPRFALCAGIDRLKGVHQVDRPATVWENLACVPPQQRTRFCVCHAGACSDVFGGKPEFSFSWLVPTRVNFSDTERLVGYRLDVVDSQDAMEMV